MRKILVTGGSGLIGSEFVGEQYVKISSKDCDLTSQEQVDNLFWRNEFDGVIHCAAKVGGVLGNINHKGEFFYDNIMMNTNIIEKARQHGIKDFVCFLSTCIFPNEVEYPLRESKIHLGPPHLSNDAYAYAKRMADVQIRAYREQYGLNYKCVIPCNVYGPNDRYDIVNGHVIPSLIHKCYLAKTKGYPFVVWGSGEPQREFIYSKDVAKLTEWVFENYTESEPIILSSATEIRNKDLVDLVVKLMDFQGEIIWDINQPDGQLRKPSSNAKIKKYLPDFKLTNLKDGLEETIKYFINNYKSIRK